MFQLERYPSNPLFTANGSHAWESLNVFNATVIYYNDLFHMLYRAQGLDYVSYLGYGVSEDGFQWKRLDQPVLKPANQWEIRGVEDPRITFIDGWFYILYTGYSPLGIRVCLARSKNLISWERLGMPLPEEDNKDAALFPEKIGGRYWILHRREPDIWLAQSTDLLHWDNHQAIMHPISNGWQHKKIGIAGTPSKVEGGWLLIYHAVDRGDVYRLGAALLDAENPSIVKARLGSPILEPRETWEIRGDVPNVVFSCGHVIKDGILYVYYGGADRVMALATCKLQDLLIAFG